MKAHRTTSTWSIDDSKQGYKEVFQYWHWYDCGKCGDHWEMWDFDESGKSIYFCPCCGQKGEVTYEALGSSGNSCSTEGQVPESEQGV